MRNIFKKKKQGMVRSSTTIGYMGNFNLTGVSSGTSTALYPQGTGPVTYYETDGIKVSNNSHQYLAKMLYIIYSAGNDDIANYNDIEGAIEKLQIKENSNLNVFLMAKEPSALLNKLIYIVGDKKNMGKVDRNSFLGEGEEDYKIFDKEQQILNSILNTFIESYNKPIMHFFRFDERKELMTMVKNINSKTKYFLTGNVGDANIAKELFIQYEPPRHL